jgi:hypothetical protein
LDGGVASSRLAQCFEQQVPMGDDVVVSPFELFVGGTMFGMSSRLVTMLAGHLKQLFAFAALLVLGQRVFMPLKRLLIQPQGRGMGSQPVSVVLRAFQAV